MKIEVEHTKNLRQVGAWTEPLPVFMSLSKGLESDNEHGNAQRQDSSSMEYTPSSSAPTFTVFFVDVI